MGFQITFCVASTLPPISLLPVLTRQQQPLLPVSEEGRTNGSERRQGQPPRQSNNSQRHRNSCFRGQAAATSQCLHMRRLRLRDFSRYIQQDIYAHP